MFRRDCVARDQFEQALDPRGVPIRFPERGIVMEYLNVFKKMAKR